MDLKRLQQFGSLASYRRGHVLFKMGDLDPNMYIILKGVVSVRSKIGDSFESEILEAGKFFGETTVILDIPKMDICVIEEDDTTLLSIPRTRFESFIKEDQGFAMRIMRLMSEQLLEAIGARENMARRIRKYEPVQTPDIAQDLYSPLTPGKEQEQRKEPQAGNTPDSQPALPAMLEALQILKGIGVVLPNHSVYKSVQWPRAADYLTPKTISCPICEQTFVTTYFSRSRLGAAKTHPDTRRQYKEIEPVYFDIYACSHCGYANFSEDFSKVSKDAVTAISTGLVMIKGIPHDMDEMIFDINYVFLKLYLALFCHAENKENVLATPKIWVRLSWMYDDVGEVALARTATERAYDAYVNLFYNTKTFSGEAEKDVLLLMGELALKQEKDKEALNHFMSVIQSGTANNVQRKRAEDRIYDIRHKDKDQEQNSSEGTETEE